MKRYQQLLKVSTMALLVALFGLVSACGGEDDPAEVETADFAVEIDVEASQLEVGAGATVEVHADIENIGDAQGIQDIEFEIGDAFEATEEEVELGTDESTTVTFQWETAEGDEGDYTAVVRSDDDEDSVDVIVDVGVEAFFAIYFDEAESTLDVTLGDPLEFVVEVENTGAVADTQEVSFFVDDTELGFQEGAQPEATLEPGESEMMGFNLPTGEGETGLGAGDYVLTAMTDDDDDSVDISVAEPDVDPAIGGVVIDDETDEPLEGVEVALYEAGDEDVVDTVVTDADGEYEFADVDDGDYEITLSAPGLNPDHVIDESDNGNVVTVSVDGDVVDQDLTVEWLRTTDLFVDGGILEFDFQAYDDMTLELPGCEEDGGSWMPVMPDDPDNIDVSYDPDDACFRIEDVAVSIADGELDFGADDVHFPEISAEIDDSDGTIHDALTSATVNLETVVEDVAGDVNYVDGSLNIDLDVRFLVGGSAHSAGFSVDFGTDAGYDDCQLTGAWGGDVENPAEDDGDYLHDPIEIRVTTGESGPDALEGETYEDGVFVVIDNALEIGQISEGEYGVDNPGGAACGYFDEVDGEEIDYAGFINDMLNLPNEGGDVLIEFDFLVP